MDQRDGAIAVDRCKPYRYWALTVLCALAASNAPAQTQAATPQTAAEAAAPAAANPASSAPAPSDLATPQEADDSAAEAETPITSAFTVRVQAPGEIAELLEKHLGLAPYQAASDLDAAELDRLMALAASNARNLLGAQGYFNPDIRVTRSSGPDGRAQVLVAADPGPVTRVGKVSIEFEGDIAQAEDWPTRLQRNRITRGWELPEGDAFTQDRWSDAKNTALRGLIARRYPAGKISYSLADIRAPENTAQLTVRLDSGPEFRLGELQITGVRRYNPVLAPRLARLPSGQVYDQEKLAEAQQRLTTSGYFDSAYIYIDPESATPEAVPVQIQVQEAKLQRALLGLGYSTDGGARASLEYQHNRVPGFGWRALTKLQLEKKHSYFQTDWQGIPAANGWRLGTLVKLDRLDDGELITRAEQLRYGRSKTDRRYDRSYYLQFDRARVNRSGGAKLSDARAGDGAALSVHYAWTGRYFNNLQFPTRGYGLSAELGAGMTLQAPRKPFVRALARAMRYFALGDGAAASRLALRAEGAAVLTHSAARVPGNLLFRTGGNTTVRGYGWRAIGIDYDDGAVISPGRYMAAGSIEWQRPILKDGKATMFEHIVFVDAGDVTSVAARLRPRLGVGTGVRMRTPVGPLEVDVAYGLKIKTLRLHLNVGFVW
ncbi:MAG: BamA/TamA family outer membrane protein [Burkholderiaceae bacterium]|jgi:translocation and assembly module TamA|nr:BamA/TamA family outer membrane protein [Burkholderiaceae bacterium]